MSAVTDRVTYRQRQYEAVRGISMKPARLSTDKLKTVCFGPETVSAVGVRHKDGVSDITPSYFGSRQSRRLHGGNEQESARERSHSVSPKRAEKSSVLGCLGLEEKKSRKFSSSDDGVNVAQETGASSISVPVSQGYYGNYDEMKEHLSRHPRNALGRVPSRKQGEQDNVSDPSPGQASADVKHLTERDVHAYFEGTGVKSTLETTKHVARRVGFHSLGNKDWWKRFAKQTFPILNVCQTYKMSYLLPDLLAGASTGISAIPIGMSYARLANFAPEHGLYCQLFYAAVYMFLGTGRQVCVGTSAVEAMIAARAVLAILGYVLRSNPRFLLCLSLFVLCFSSLRLLLFLFHLIVCVFFAGGRGPPVEASFVCRYGRPDSSKDEFTNASYGLGLFVGLFLTLMRFFGLGVVSSFVADSVVSGFSTGCSFTIAASQLQHLFGINVPGPLRTPQTVWHIISHAHETRWICLVIGTVGLLLLILLEFINRVYLRRCPLPISLSFMTVFILLGYVLRIDGAPYNVPVVGKIPKGLPKPVVFNFKSSLLGPLLQQALWYSVVYYFIHISVAKTVAQKHDYALDYNQELFATGVSSIVGSFFQCYPIATSVARTSICDGAGGLTQLYNVVNVATIILVVTVLTPLLYYLPWAALASVVFFGVYKMMYFNEALRLLRLFSFDFLLWIVSFLVTVIWGAMEGIITSVVLSLVWIVKENAFPGTAVLGRLPGTKVFRNTRVFPEAQEIRGCKILRFDASLNFSNAVHFEKKILQLIPSGPAAAPPPPSATHPTTVQTPTKIWVKTTTNELVETERAAANTQTEDASLSQLGNYTEAASTQIPAADSSMASSSCDQLQTASRSSLAAAGSASQQDIDRIRVVIIDASSVNHVDVTAIRMLKNVARKLEANNMIMLFANWKGPMRGFLEKARFYDTIPPDHCFLSIHDAVLWAEIFYLHREPSVVKNDLTPMALDNDVASALHDNADRFALPNTDASVSTLQPERRCSDSFVSHCTLHPTHQPLYRDPSL